MDSHQLHPPATPPPLRKISSSPMMLRPKTSSLGRIEENCNGIVASGDSNSAVPKLCRHGSLILKGANVNNNGFLSATSSNQRHKLSLGEQFLLVCAHARIRCARVLCGWGDIRIRIRRRPTGVATNWQTGAAAVVFVAIGLTDANVRLSRAACIEAFVCRLATREVDSHLLPSAKSTITEKRNDSPSGTRRFVGFIRQSMCRRMTETAVWGKSWMTSLSTDNIRSSIKERSSGFFRNRIGSRRIRNRLVQKTGLCNVSLVNVPKQRRKYFSDIFTTVIEVKWRWCLLFFSMSFVVSWSIFTCVYYSLIMSHGDLERVDEIKAGTWTPCIGNAHTKLNIFLFAFTTQTTIGYGYRYPTDECPQVIIVMCFQFMVGVMIQTLMAGVIFAKLARPIKRAATIIFSKNAVISMRNGKLCLLFRVGDMRKSSLAESHVRLQMIKKCITEEGELLPFHQFDMNVGYDDGTDRVFVVWPITIVHEIDEDSPLYDISKESLTTARFEIIAILEGVVESTGSTTQARTSYLPSELLWGKRFEKLVTYQRENGEYRIDFGKFHNVYEVDTPDYSAKEMDEMRAAGLAPEAAYRVKSEEEAENEGQTPYASIQHTNIGDNRYRPSIFEQLSTMEQAPLI
uniref:Uncharacterized protein n=1 Tax=Plectus sambesii TaxID=2011161 RepID=A0A914W372_9BILA